MSEPLAEEGGGDGGSASEAAGLRSHASVRALPEEPETSVLEAHLHGRAKDLSVRRPLSTPLCSAASEPGGRTRAASSEKSPCSDPVSIVDRRSTEASAFSRSPERDKVGSSLTKEAQRKWQPEVEDLTQRVQGAGDRVGCMEAFEEMVAHINAKLQAREEDIAQLRNEIHTVRPTVVAGEADVTDAAAVEDMRGAFSDLLQEQAKRQDEALAGLAARLAVVEQQTQEQLSSSTALSSRVGQLEAELKEGAGAAVKTAVESTSKELRSESLETTNFKEDSVSPARVRRSFSLVAAMNATTEHSPVVPPRILEEEEEEPMDRSPSALRAPRMSIIRGHEFRREKTMPALTQTQIKSPPVRRSVKDLAEVMRARRDSCEEWSSSGQLAAALATPSSPSPVSGASKAVGSPSEVACGSEDQWLEKASSAHGAAESTRPQPRGQPEDSWLEKASSARGAAESTRPQPRGQPEAGPTLGHLSARSVELSARSSEQERRDFAEVAALVKRVEVMEQTLKVHGKSQVERLDLIEGHVQAGERRLQDLQAGLAVEIRAMVKDLLQALPPPEEHQRHSQLEAEKAAVQTQLELEQARLTQEACALTKRMSLLETQVQETLGELREGHSIELSALREQVGALAGDRQPLEECQADKPAEVPCDSRVLPPTALPEADEEADLAEEFQRHAEGSDSRIEELMKKLLAQQSEGTEQQEAAGETNTLACSEVQDPSRDLVDDRSGLGEEQNVAGTLLPHSPEKPPELGVRELPEAAFEVQQASDQPTQLAGTTADHRCAVSSSAADARPQERSEAPLDESCGVEHAGARADLGEVAPQNRSGWHGDSGAAQCLDHLEARVSELERRAQQLVAEGETTGPVSEMLAEVREKVEALVRHQSQASSKAEEQQESLEALQGQVGALEQCLEENDGKLGEIQTTFATAKIEGLVNIDERVKALEGHAKASPQGSPQGSSDPASVVERLTAVEQRVQEADGGLRRVQEEQRSEVCWLRRHFQQLEALMSPRFARGTWRRQSTEDRPPEVQAESLAVALDPAALEDLSSDDRVKALQRYVDDRLRKLKNDQEEQKADTADLQRRFDAQTRTGHGRSAEPASPASKVDTAVDTTDVTERLQTLEGKCATMLEMILRL